MDRAYITENIDAHNGALHRTELQRVMRSNVPVRT
jgi:hypothetical protein